MATVQRSVVPPSPVQAYAGQVSVGRRDAVRLARRPARPAGAAGGRGVRGGGCAAGRPLPAGAGRESWDRPPLRLTRRGRRVVAGLSIAIGLAVAVATAMVVGSESGPVLRLAGVETVVVEAGDTLWAIAVDAAPEEDPRAVVDAIRDLNELDGVALEPGRVLQLP
ncbi:LysM peptidoglycan-binding domain-containing protein [Modestobacter marinus]|uniref:LysM peptidoglycan-binding domain-containing protein n=1 Tax=Modestobacter marinus TaxID=477641 RepID=UPI001C95821D|nr:LysM peptidoglycan-binding domain-containing protein [Modestobacter marinus]